MKKLFIALGLTMVPVLMSAKVVPGSLITDNMVLRQNGKAKLYGTATPGSEVKATPSWDNVTRSVKAGTDGKWQLFVETPAGGYTPYTITLSDSPSKKGKANADDVVLKNVLIGEVWLASGQSNMEMPLKGFAGCCTEGGYDEIATSRQKADKIRFFVVPLKQSDTPLEEVSSTWTVPSPDTSPDYSALAWNFAKRLNDVLDVPVGIVNCAYGGAKVESWTPREIVETYSDVSLDPADIEKMVHYHRPVLMYNAMFNPVKNYTYDGIIWYQGCSNVGRHEDYPVRLSNMVEHWRKEIGEREIPFYSVEIAPCEYGSADGKSWAPLLREAQWKATDIIPNSGIICTNDLVKPYERFNIHPSDKATPGKRLAELALNKTYGKTRIPVVSPHYKSHKFEDGAAWVAIDSPSDGICRNYDVVGFEVAGPDKVFHPADSVWFKWQTNEFVVSSKEVPEPVSVRYGWRDFLPGNVHGGNYLPLIPFRTDDWQP